MKQLLCALVCSLLFGSALARGNAVAAVTVDQLPAEARTTLRLIDAGGPFPYRRDGIAFQNRERRLPAQPKGYYREYTVPTPGSSDRGARRVITGGKPPLVFYYTADHYKTFNRIER
jgi:guanyl-specific ribonuclease Sa